MTSRLLILLSENWLLVLLIVFGSSLAIRWLIQGINPLRTRSHGLVWFVATLLFLLGSFIPKSLFSSAPNAIHPGAWLLMVALIVLLIQLIWLVASGGWSYWLALGCSALALLGIGAWGMEPLQAAGIEIVKGFRSIEFVQPFWLLLLLFIPIVIQMSFRSLANLGPFRRWLALGLRCLLILLLALALAEPRLRRPNENLTLLFLVDRSLSVPQDLDASTADSPGGAIDRRWKRIQNFINESVARRGPNHRNDQSGVIFFGKRPKLVLPPAAVDRMIVSDSIAGPMDANYTDIAAAIKLALASFPEGTGRRIVLISDGNENLGNAEEQANLAKQNGVEIDSVKLATGYRNENEVLVQAVEAPPVTTKGQRLPIRVLLRNTNPSRVVYGKLELLQSRDGRDRPVQILPGFDVLEATQSPALVRLKPGLNAFTFRDKADADTKDEEFSFSYRAVFQPIGTSDLNGGSREDGLIGDRVQNNRGLTHVIARGQRRVLFIEQQGGAAGFIHQHLMDQLRLAKFQIIPIGAARLPQNKGDLAVFLSNYDCVIIGDVPAEALTKDQQEVIRSNTYDQGCGLVVIGGPDSFGSGGYHKTPIETALPVDCEIKAMKAAGKGGLVMIMHASEMADGNKWQKDIAKLAIQRLGGIDMVGIMQFDLNIVKWQIPFQTVGGEKGRLIGLVDSMFPGDMPNFDPFLSAAYKTLANPDHKLTTKHVIIISDGDPQLGIQGKSSLADMAADNITVSTVGVATHGMTENTRMEEIANAAAKGGKFYNVTDPTKLPAIYIKESRRVSQSYVYLERFNPKLIMRSGPTEKLDSSLPDLHGFVRTTMKPSPLAEMLIEGPRTFDQRFPILAAWQYGLGRSVAFTSDAKSIPMKVEGWDRRWLGSDMYLKFWEQVIGWAMRGVETDRLIMTTEYRDGKVRILVEARDDNNRPLTDLRIDGAVSTPAGLTETSKPLELKFEQRAGGYYEAEFKAEEAGTYLVNARAKQLVPMFKDGQPRYKGRKESGLPMKVLDSGNGKLTLTDGTEVKRNPDGTYSYADDGKPVEIQDKVEKIIDSRRSGVTLSYSPEFGDLETNSALLEKLSRITGGEVHIEDEDVLKKLAESANLYRPAPPGVSSLQPFWFWLVFAAGMALFLDVAVRRISIEPAEVQAFSQKSWAYFRKRHSDSSADADAFLARLKQRKVKVEETIEQSKASRRFDPTTAPRTEAPAGADTGDAKAAIFTPPPPTPKAEPKPQESGDDYFSKLRKAKQRAPHERDSDKT